MMCRVAMLITNPYVPDVRAQKEAHTLALAGCTVTVIAWDRENRYSRHEVETIPAALEHELAEWSGRAVATPQPVTVVRIPVTAGFRTGRRLLRALPRFWVQAWHELRRAQPDVVHAHDLDTLPLAYIYKKLTGTPVVYDAREYYPGMVRANVGIRLSQGLEALDRWLTPRADAVITVGERLAERLRAMGGRVWVVHNSQPWAGPNPDRGLRAAWGVPDDACVVVYAGYLTPDRMIAPLLAAVPEMERVWLVIAGDGPQMDIVQAAARDCDRIKALGWIPLADVPAVVASGDVVYYGLNADDPNSTYFMPNLAFFAWAAGRPILTTPVGEIADVVRQEGCGVVLEAATPDAVRIALARFNQREDYVTFSERGRLIGQERMRWRSAATALWAAYASVGIVKKDKKWGKRGNKIDQ